MRYHVLALFVVIASAVAAPQVERPPELRSVAPPLAFEAAASGSQGAFVARGAGYDVAIDAAGAAVDHGGAKGPIRLDWVGGDPEATPVAEDPQLGRSHYLIGSDVTQWRRRVPRFARLRCAEVYPGIDVVWYGNAGRLEFDLVVAPGADASQVALRLDGTERASVDATGAVVLGDDAGALRLLAPLAYQELGGERVEVASRFVVRRDGAIAIEVAPHDRALPLVIDPVLAYGTFLGGAGADSILGMARDAAGNLYLTGFTTSLNFPVLGPVQASLRGIYDIFVTKLDPTGSQMIYSTYIGGTGAFGDDEWPLGIAVDDQGQAVVLGRTENADFPVRNAFQPNKNAGVDAVVFKLDASGSQLVYSTFLGGSSNEIDRDSTIGGGSGDVVIDGAGFAIVAGSTESTDFPTNAAGRQRQFAGGTTDGFVVRFDTTGQPIYASYLGGSSSDQVDDLELGPQGSLFLAGGTISRDFPTTAGAYSRVAPQGFITRMDPVTQVIGSSTFFPLGIADLALDPSGDAYLVGGTSGNNVPTTMGAHQVSHGGSFMSHIFQAWIAKLDQDLGHLVYATYYGGPSDNESAGAVVADASGHAYVAGTSSERFGTPSQGAFLIKVNAVGSALVYTTSFGPRDGNSGPILLESSGRLWSTGTTWANGGFATPGALQTVHAGNRDVILGRVEDSASRLVDLDIPTDRVSSGAQLLAAVTLDGAAPAGGISVQLQSSDPWASVPASIVVPEGSATGLFAITGGAVSTAIPATVTATVFGESRSVDLKVWPGPLYHVTPILPAGGGETIANGINAFGDVVAFAPTGSQLLRYSGAGGVEVLGTGEGRAINDDGQIAGRTGTAFRYTNEVGIEPLGALQPGRYSEGNGINASGQVCGFSDVVMGGISTGRAFRYTDGVGMVNLGSLGERSAAYGINRAGHVVGNAQVGSVTLAFLYTGETGMQSLGTLPGFVHTAGFGINDANQVVGQAATSSFGSSNIFLWTPGAGMADLGRLGGQRASGTAVNSFGHVVGTSDTSTNDSFAVLHDGTSLVAFEDLVSGADAFAWNIGHAADINDQGQIAGTGSFRDNGRLNTAFRLEPAFFPPYGAGCRGTSEKIPGLMGTGYPIGGNRVELRLSGPPGAQATIAVSAAAADTPLAGCRLLLASPFFALSGPMVLDQRGTARVAIDLPPATPAVSLFLQGIVVDAGAPSGVFTFSNGVEMKIR